MRPSPYYLGNKPEKGEPFSVCLPCFGIPPQQFEKRKEVIQTLLGPEWETSWGAKRGVIECKKVQNPSASLTDPE